MSGLFLFFEGEAGASALCCFVIVIDVEADIELGDVELFLCSLRQHDLVGDTIFDQRSADEVGGQIEEFMFERLFIKEGDDDSAWTAFDVIVAVKVRFELLHGVEFVFSRSGEFGADDFSFREGDIIFFSKIQQGLG